MKKLLLFLLPVLSAACSDSNSSPTIQVDKLYVNNNSEVNYANKTDELPALKKGDEITAALTLDGNGADLKTFLLKTDDKLSTELLYQHTEVSSDENLTNEKEGQLRFRDGVNSTHLMVKASVKEVDKNGNVQLVFYLSSKAECEGAQEVIALNLDEEDR